MLYCYEIKAYFFFNLFLVILFLIVSPIVLEIQPYKVSFSLILRGYFWKTTEPTFKIEVSLNSPHHVDYHIFWRGFLFALSCDSR